MVSTQVLHHLLRAEEGKRRGSEKDTLSCASARSVINESRGVGTIKQKDKSSLI